jgi:monofunctional glycosyltransferase
MCNITLKWTCRILEKVVRIVLLLLIIYSIVFTLVATFAIYKLASYGYGFYSEVTELKDDQPKMSHYMQMVQDSNPDLVLKQEFVPLDSISPNLRKAVLASEDAGFYFHPGFDVRAIAEALEANQARGKTKFGGSTITQQLAKNMFLTNERSWERKFKELAFALLMEKELGKDRILELYLNYAQWGPDLFGCQAACKAYYHKSCSRLSMDQAINMAAVLASPVKHTPFMNTRFMQSRRSVIYQNLYIHRDSIAPDSTTAAASAAAATDSSADDDAVTEGISIPAPAPDAAAPAQAAPPAPAAPAESAPAAPAP